MIQPKPIVLMVLDGWGYREATDYNAIAQAHTPTWDGLWSDYPHTLISGSGLDVGLPCTQMGNSEVGHLHMGAGRQVPQDLVRIDQAIENGSFNNNPVLLEAITTAKRQDSALHILGLLSPGGVHSHENHILALLKLAAAHNVNKVYLHAILDGRDTPPRSALSSIARIEKHFHATRCGAIASLCGRYYAMDRDKRWDRVQRAYDLYTKGTADFHATNAAEALVMAYERNEGDEFVQPTAIGQTHIIKDNDVVIFMNFRADRARQLSHAFLDQDFAGFTRTTYPKLALYVSLTRYSDDLPTTVAFPPIELNDVFGALVANVGLHQLRIAETEKYAHVTFFFNGGREQPFDHEDRILVPSPKVPTYDLAPEMSAPEITQQLISAIHSQKYDVIILNFANPDMVGHTGNMPATIKAIECIDQCLKDIIHALQKVGGEALITADHGNAEFMYDEAHKQPHTAHTTNPVPLLYVGRKAKASDNGSLVDIAPTLCYLLGIQKPASMTGKSLFEFIDEK